jgi:hypothetical protein
LLRLYCLSFQGCVEILFEIAKVPNFFRRLKIFTPLYLSLLNENKGRQIKEENKKNNTIGGGKKL